MSTQIRVDQRDKYCNLDDMMFKKLKAEIGMDWAHEFNEDRDRDMNINVEAHEPIIERSPEPEFMPGM